MVKFHWNVLDTLYRPPTPRDKVTVFFATRTNHLTVLSICRISALCPTVVSFKSYRTGCFEINKTYLKNVHMRKSIALVYQKKVSLTYAFILSVVPPIANTTCYTSTNDSTMMYKKYLVKYENWLCFKIMNF